MRISLALLLVPAVVGFLASTDAYCQDCVPHCVEAVCPEDIIRNFNELIGGEILGTVCLSAGPCGTAAFLDGNGAVSLGADARFNAWAVEIEVQLQLDRLPGPGQMAFGVVTDYLNHSPSLSALGLFIEANIPGEPAWMLCGDGTSCILSDPTRHPIQTGVLYCVRAFLRGEYGEIWVNGERVAFGQVNRNPENPDTPMIIGNSAGGENAFYGMIDEVRIGCLTPCAPHAVPEVCPGDLVCHFEGSDYCGTPQGTVGLCMGAWGQGVCFDGSGWIDFGDDPSYTRDLLEVEAQVNITSLPGQGSMASQIAGIYRNHLSTESEFALFIESNIAGAPAWMLCGDGTQCIFSDPNQHPIETGRTYCVRAVPRGREAEIWVDGQIVAFGEVNRNSTNTTTHLTVGNSASGDNPLWGMADELRIGCPDPPLAVTEPLPMVAAGLRIDIYPNPTFAGVTIRVDSARSGDVKARVYSATGRLVRAIDEWSPNGQQRELQWDGRDAAGKSVASGRYFVRIEDGMTRATKQIVVLH